MGETLQECMVRELEEEVGATVIDFEFLFLHENFILFEGEYLHGLELFVNSNLIPMRFDSNQVKMSFSGWRLKSLARSIFDRSW